MRVRSNHRLRQAGHRWERLRRYAVATAVAGALAGSALTGAPPARAADAELPDLQPQKPPYVDLAFTYAPTLGVFYFGEPQEPRLLRFTTVATNVGPRPVDLIGVPSEDPLSLVGHQCVRWTGPVCSDREAVGALRWHGEHRHWHFNDFAVYELRRLTPSGDVDRSPEGLIGDSTKASFCLEDTERATDEASPVPAYRGCSGVVQGISPDWSDVYLATTPGQQIVLDGVTDGRYGLVVRVDPLNRLIERDEQNNDAWAVIEIANNVTTARLVPDSEL